MPWRGPEFEGDFPSLGWQVIDWIEANVVVPDRDVKGQPFVLTSQQADIVAEAFRLDPDTGRFVHSRGAQVTMPQKWGKGPLAGAWTLAEAAGPVLPDGWDAQGEPVGKPWSTPWIQVTAYSEDQTDNVYLLLLPMIQLGPLADEIRDAGLTRIMLPGGGKIEPVTSADQSRLGQRITFAMQDEVQSWTRANKLRATADTQRRNVAGMGGRFLATGNAWDPAESSVAQLTAEADPTSSRVFVYYPIPPSGSVRNKRERRKVMREIYGDSLEERGGWIDLDRLDDEITALIDEVGDPQQAERYFLNRSVATEDAAFDPARWAALTDSTVVIADGEQITVGVDGARSDDAIAVIATHIESGHQWPLGIWERPRDAGDDYEHPQHELDGVITEAMERWSVWRIYVDPQYIEYVAEGWLGRWPKQVAAWWMNRPKAVAHAVRAYAAAIEAGDVTHDGDATFARHVGNARKRPVPVRDDQGRRMWTLAKPTAEQKIDAAAAAVISWQARSDAVTAGVLSKPKYRTASY